MLYRAERLRGGEVGAGATCSKEAAYGVECRWRGFRDVVMAGWNARRRTRRRVLHGEVEDARSDPVWVKGGDGKLFFHLR